MIDSVGPVIQPQIKDVADWSEVVFNFRDWKTPRDTNALLIFFGVLIVATTFASTEFCVRSITLATILTFFLHRPIIRRYPRFYLIFAPAHWIFWDIPTQPETAFRYLRVHANNIRETAFRRHPSLAGGPHPDLRVDVARSDVIDSDDVAHTAVPLTKVSEPSGSDILVARCKLGSTAGTLVLNFDHIRFVRHFPREDMWKRPYNELVEVRKGNGQTSVDKSAENSLELEFIDGSVEKIEGLKGKDEVFNVIIAFSGLAWQQV